MWNINQSIVVNIENIFLIKTKTKTIKQANKQF